MKKWLSILPLSLILLLCACQSSDASAQIFAMDTVMDLTVQGSGSAQALKDAEAELYRLDALLSRQDSASAVSALNESAGSPVAVEEELYNLLQTAVEYSTLTDGAFAVTVAPIMDAWDFTGEHPRVPSRAELDSLLSLAGDERIVFGSGTVTLEPGMAVDLGGIAKGYASDRLAELFAADGVSSAMVSLGGNVYVRGTKRDGSLLLGAIEDPNDTAAYLGVLSLQDRFIITSGGYQRYFERDGVTYYHIIDPKTGDVARSGLLSATVVSDNGTMGDALSTALFVMGREKAVQFWRTSGLDFDMVLCDDSGHVYYTEGLKESFDTSLAEHAYEYICIPKH